MSKLILVRHGQSQWNLENRFTGWADVPLTDAGRQEAQKAAERIQDRMLAAGFLIGVGGTYGNVLRVQPPLVISDEALDCAVVALDRAFCAA
jgi:2,3-bisphosphoglycerate-dependent phosphoglycerate mutase